MKQNKPDILGMSLESRAVIDGMTAAIFAMDMSPTDDDFLNCINYVEKELEKSYVGTTEYIHTHLKVLKEYYYDVLDVINKKIRK